MSLVVGQRVEVDIDRIAHGGHFVGRYDSQVVFVRHTAPGERVLVEITEIGKGGRLAFADTIEVITPSAKRITPACTYVGVCGGCDFQHLDLAYTRELKAEILREQLIRLGKMDVSNPLLQNLEVAAMSETETGLHWRSRMRYATTRAGRIGLRKANLADTVQIGQCLIAEKDISADDEIFKPWAANSEVIAIRTSGGQKIVHSIEAKAEIVTEKVFDHEYQVSSVGFWQAHRLAPRVFVQTALEMLGDLKSKHVLDLYAGVGLFSLPLAKAVGPGGRVEAVESFAESARLLRRNLRPNENWAFSYSNDVLKWLRSSSTKKVDAVLIDPPRSGANREVLRLLTRLRPQQILYVACDPAALGRDTQILAELGFELSEIRAFDAFPNTAHFETFAKFTPAKMPR